MEMLSSRNSTQRSQLFIALTSSELKLQAGGMLFSQASWFVSDSGPAALMPVWTQATTVVWRTDLPQSHLPPGAERQWGLKRGIFFLCLSFLSSLHPIIFFQEEDERQIENAFTFSHTPLLQAQKNALRANCALSYLYQALLGMGREIGCC